MLFVVAPLNADVQRLRGGSDKRADANRRGEESLSLRDLLRGRVVLAGLRHPGDLELLIRGFIGLLNLGSLVGYEESGEIPAGRRTGKDLAFELVTLRRPDEIEPESIDQL